MQSNNPPKVPSPGKELIVPNDWYSQVDRAGIITSYDLSTVDGRRKVLEARTADCDGAEDYINRTIEISHVLMHSVEMTDHATGENNPEIRTILIGPDGKKVSFVSRGIVDAIQLIARYGSPPPWDPPIKLLLKRKQLSHGRSTYTLTEVD